MRAFQDIVRSYNGYDWDKDGIKEIESLKLLLTVNQDFTVDPGKKLVVALVESRLLQNISDGKFTPQDLSQRFATFKEDLVLEGRQAVFLEMTTYSGQPRQDSKTVLAIRNFLKDIRNSISNFEGVILIGSFPDARVTRIYPNHGTGADHTQWAGTPCYREAGFYFAGPRHDIVLADLDGHWDALYKENYQPTRHSFFITGVTTVSNPEPNKYVLKNPSVVTNEDSQPATLPISETLFLNDVNYTIHNLPQGTVEVEFYLNDRNPEVGPQDALHPNPIATPDILVSRINARSVAVKPPKAAGALDPSGKPQATSTLFAPDQWERDPALERSLLIDYFDRNHAYRSGRFANVEFGVSVIKPGHYPHTGLAYDGLDGWNCPKKDFVQGDATLLDLIHWLKTPSLFRAISAHADCDYTDVINDDSIYRLAEEAAGGHPWNWVQQGGSFMPSFKGINANLSLYRTLWENRQLASVPPSLMIHGGCAVNAAKNSDSSYNHDSYGTFQNAESLLFYGNQLAVMCRNTWWNHGPLGFGKGMAPEEATFGEGWRGFFTRYAADSSLILNEEERKRCYEWCVVGDWTLQKYYQSRTSLPVRGMVALKTVHGNTLTVVNGGGLGGPNTGPEAVALHTDAVAVGPWERFRVEWLDDDHQSFALKTMNGNYLTAVNGGGIGGPNDSRCPVHTDASWVGPWEKLTLEHDRSSGTVALRTPNGRYITAVNGGGFGGANNVPIHTDAAKVGPWETFSFVRIWKAGLKTQNGNYITVVNGGGLGGPNNGPQAVALHTDATEIGPWERFTLEWLDPGHKTFALKTMSGNYLTVFRGGGIGGPNNWTSPVHTDASWLGPWETLTIIYDERTGIVSIQTPTGRYLTAVNGGGFGGSGNAPIHTNATEAHEWETLSLVILR